MEGEIKNNTEMIIMETPMTNAFLKVRRQP